MKAFVFATLAVLGLSFASPVAQANWNEVKSPFWTCDLHFNARGTDVQFVIGYNKIKGYGELNCIDSYGLRETIPLYIEIGTRLVAPRLSFRPKVNIYGWASGIGLATDPQDLIDDYRTVEVTGAVGVGAGVALALQGNRNSATINLGLQGLTRSFGLAVGYTKVSLYDARYMR